MRLYKTTIGQWAGTQADARTFKATHGVDFEQVEVPTDKPGLLDFLNRHAVGSILLGPATDDATPTAPSLAVEPMTEDAFEALPLAMQLHLAALALENARQRIRD